MSRFYASIQGNRGEATRQGHSRIDGHIRGWNSGVRVVGMVFGDASTEEPSDRFVIYATSGSNGSTPDVLIGYVYQDGHFEPAHA